MSKSARFSVAVLLAAVITTLGCFEQPTTRVTEESPPDVPNSPDVVFLTRDGCVTSPILRANLDAALSALKMSTDYTVVDQGELDANDPRSGYPSPTILVDGKDMFGMAVPAAPFPAPS